MNGSQLRAFLVAVCCSLVLLPFEVRGQFSTPKLVEEIDPRAGQIPGSFRERLPATPQPPKPERDAPDAEVATDDEVNEEPTFIPGRESSGGLAVLEALNAAAGKPDAGTPMPDAGLTGQVSVTQAQAPDAGAAAPTGEAPGRTIVPPPADGEAQLLAAWKARLNALEARSFRAAEEHEARLLSLRDELGHANLFAMASAVALEARAMLESDPVEAKRRALYSAALAPDLPFAHWTVAIASRNEDSLGFGQYLGAVKQAIQTSLHEPRWRAALFADASAALFGALLVGTLCALLLAFARHLSCLLHDLRHALPTGATRLQVVLIIVLLACAPAVLGLGAFGLIAMLVMSAWLYMNHAERIVFAAFVGLLGLLPMGARIAASNALYAGTRAEAIYLVERGGLEGPARQTAFDSLAEQPSPQFHVLFAKGRQARTRGNVQASIDWLRRAAEQRPDSPETLVELGNALLLFGDLDGARDTYERAARLAPERGEANFNLARLFARKSQLVPPEDASYELGHSQEYVRKTIAIDSRLGMAAAGEIDYRANRFLASMPLGPEVLAELTEGDALPERLEQEVARRLFDRVPAPAAPLVSLAFVALLGLLALSSRAFRVSGRCSKCGRPACRRCDVEVSGPGLCGQCLYVFNQRAVVDPTARAEKELGIQRHQKRRAFTVKLLSLLLPGGGLVLLGRTARGVLTMVTVAALAFPLAHGSGLVPVPTGNGPGHLKVVAIVLGALLWALAARSTFKAFKAPVTKG